jgi:outer membrane protein TolC
VLKKVTKIILIISVGALISCAKRSPEPISNDIISKSAGEDLAKIKQIKEQNDLFNLGLKIDLYTAIALAIENNKDLRVKILETSLSHKKIEDVKFDMLPTMAANAGYTSSDKYKATTSATVPSNDKAGSIGNNYSTSRNRDVFEQDVGFSWNVLDFGLSYIRAGQSSDRYLISKELEEKVASNIKRDVIRAYWNALSADKLIRKYDPLLIKVNNALNDSQKIEELLLQKPMDALLYQKELLDIQRALQSQKQTFVNAKIELGSLMGLLPNEKFTLVETDLPINELDMKIDEMESHALVNRSELLENRYEERISIAETKAGMRSLLPGLNFNAAWTSSSNDYLMNKTNFEYGSSIGANLLNVFRAPKLKKINKKNTEIIKEQRLALSMAVLSQVHISNIEYQMALEEYETADRYYDVSRKITEQVRNAQKIARFGELELIREEASLLVAELRKDIAFSKVQFSIAQVYTSVGIDVTHLHLLDTKKKLGIGTNEYAQIIRNNFKYTGKKYKAYVKKPIKFQKPVLTSDNDTFSSFKFSENTFKLDGKGRTQYSANLSNNAPLPKWISFLPSQRTFVVNKKNKGKIDEIKLTVNASNINIGTKDTFTLVIDPDLRKKRLAEQKKTVKKLKKEKKKKVVKKEVDKPKTKKDKKLTKEDKKLAKIKAREDKKLAKIKAREDKKLAKIKAKEEKRLAKEQKRLAKIKAKEDKKLEKIKAKYEKKLKKLKKQEEKKLKKKKEKEVEAKRKKIDKNKKKQS